MTTATVVMMMVVMDDHSGRNKHLEHNHDCDGDDDNAIFIDGRGAWWHNV